MQKELKNPTNPAKQRKQESKQARIVLTTFGAVLESWDWYRKSWAQNDMGGISENEVRSFAKRAGVEVVETEERRRG